MFEFLTSLMGGGTGTTIGPGSMSHMSPDQWGTQVQGGSGSGSGITALLADPNIQSLMAGIGTNLDPEGVGGAIGKPTQGMIQNQQMGKAMEKQDKRWTALIDAMAGGKVGSASIKTDPKGGTSVSLKAPENTLGTLTQPMQQNQPAAPQSPFDSYMANMQSWFQKFGGGQ